METSKDTRSGLVKEVLDLSLEHLYKVRLSPGLYWEFKLTWIGGVEADLDDQGFSSGEATKWIAADVDKFRLVIETIAIFQKRIEAAVALSDRLAKASHVKRDEFWREMQMEVDVKMRRRGGTEVRHLLK